MHVPAKSSELHDKHHLCASNVDRLGSVPELSVKVVDRHVAHEKDEADPGHERTVDISGDGICSSRANEQRPHACPEVEKTNQVKERDPCSFSERFPHV